MAYERIDDSKEYDGKERDTHEVRYRIARQYVGDDDIVLDACCGTGYGQDILTDRFSAKSVRVRWIGTDNKPAHPRIRRYDYDTGRGDPLTPVNAHDVFVGLECIEHLTDAGVARFVEHAKEATHTIVISTPIVRNKNPYHIQQFSKGDIMKLFGDDTWGLYEYLEQDSKYGIFIFKKHKA